MKDIIKISDWMSTPVISISPDTTVLEAAKLLTRKKIGALVVLKDDQKVVGILSERDIVNKVVTTERDPKKILVSEIMSTDVYTVTTDASLLDITKIMNRHKIRHAVVLENDKAVGVITARDLIDMVSG